MSSRDPGLRWICVAMRRACASFGDNNVGASSLPASVCLCSTSCFASTTVLVDSASILVVKSSVCLPVAESPHLYSVCPPFCVHVFLEWREGLCTIFYVQLFHEFLQQNLLEQLSHLQVPWNFQRFASFCTEASILV